MIKRVPKLLSASCLFLFSCTLLLFQQFDFSTAYACPEPGVTDAWFIGILELENTILPEKIEVVPNYDFREGGYEFFSFFINNETNAPLYIFSLHDLETLIESENNNSLSEKINHLLVSELGFQVKSLDQFHLSGTILKSFDPKIIELNQFDYYLPENLEIPPSQNSSFVIISRDQIFTINYQLSYEVNENFNGYVIVCDMGSSELESEPATASSLSSNPLNSLSYVLLVGLLIVLIGGVVGIFILKRKSL